MSETKVRAGRNRTITLSTAQIEHYLKRSATIEDMSGGEAISNVMIHGDCFRVLPSIPDKSVDLLIVDPPYNLDKKFGAKAFHQMDTAGYEGFTRDWISSVLHTLKDTASIYVCSDWKTSLVVGSVLSDYFIVHNRITWQREKGRGANRNWKNSMEDIWFTTMSSAYCFHVDAVKQRRKVLAPYKVNGKPKDWLETEDGNFRDTFPSNIWDDISIPYWSMPENTDHPTQKPEKLMAKLILASSSEGDLILDPFAGVGTSCVVAKKLNRHYIGIEIESEYCALSEKRLEMADSDASIQGYHNGVFWERNTLAEQKRHTKGRL